MIVMETSSIRINAYYAPIEQVPLDVFHCLCHFLNKIETQFLGTASKLCNKQIVIVIQNREFSAFKIFAIFLKSHFAKNEKGYEVKRKELLLEVCKKQEMIECKNLLSIKTSLFNLKYDVFNILSKLDVSVIKKMEKAFHGSLPTSFENIFPLTVCARLIVYSIRLKLHISHPTKVSSLLDDLLAIIGLTEILQKPFENIKKDEKCIILGEMISLFLEKNEVDNAICVFNHEDFLNYSPAVSKKIEEVYKKLLEKKEIERADNFIEEISKKNMGYSSAFANLSKQLLENNPYKALEMIKKEPQMLRHLEYEQVLTKISIKLIEQGDLNKGLEVLGEIKNAGNQFPIIAAVSRHYLKLGRIDRAIEEIQKIPNKSIYASAELKNKILSEISLAVLKTGPLKDSYKEAVKIATLIFDQETRDKILKVISEELEKLDLMDEVLEVAHEIKITFYCFEAMKPTLLKLMCKGAVRRVIKIAEETPKTDLKSLLFQFICENLAQIGNTVLALELLDRIEDKHFKSNALQTIAKELFKDGMVEKAIELCYRLIKEFEEYSLVHDFSEELFKMEKAELAINLTLELLKQRSTSPTTINLMKQVIENEGFQKVVAAIKKIEVHKQKQTALYLVCEMLLEGEYYVLATGLVSEVLDDNLHKFLKCDMLEFLCDYFFDNDFLEEGADLAKTMPSEEFKMKYLEKVCEDFCEKQCYEDARKIAHSVSKKLVKHVDCYIKEMSTWSS